MKSLFSKLVVAYIFVSNTIFATACLWVFYKVHSEPIVLIGAWFGFTAGEAIVLGQITKSKKKLAAMKNKCNEGDPV